MGRNGRSDKTSSSVHLLYILLCAVNLCGSEIDFSPTERINCSEFGQFVGCDCYESKPKTMREVSCDRKNLTSIPSNVVGLVKLKVTGDSIRVINERINYPKLEVLHLEQNQIRFIDDFVFTDLGILTDLSLANNEISSLSSKTFDGLISLELLVLTGNKIYVVRAETFNGHVLPSLQILKLDQCSLFIIEPHSFSTLSHLTILNIAENHIEQLEVVGEKNDLEKLTHVNASDNRLSVINGAFFVNMPSLTHLYLDRNNLQHLRNATFRDSLTYLSLRQNRITAVEVDSFNSLRNLESLDLSYNLLVQIDFSAFPSHNLDKVLIHDNPWDCSRCINSWMVDENSALKWTVETNVSCATPSELSGLRVYENRAKVFAKCDVKSARVSLLIGFSVGTLLLASGVFLIVKLNARRQRQRMETNEEMKSLACSKMASSSPFVVVDYDDEQDDRRAFL